jgi:hypothetical protein
MSHSTTDTNGRRSRQLAAGIAAAVLIDVLWVQAPFLAFLAIPFAIIAWRYRGGAVGSVAVALVCGLYVTVGVSYMLSNGLHYAEPGEPSAWINPGDFVFVYIGTPLAAWLAVRAVGRLVRGRHAHATVAVTS